MIQIGTESPTTGVSTEPIPLVDLRSQYLRIKPEIDAAIHEVIDSTRFIKGPVVAAFETELAEYLGGKHALGVANGTEALQIALMALDIGPGDEVITPAFSFVAAAETVALLGAKPIFADIDPATFNIDVDHAASLVTERTAAIIPVNLYGQPADVDAISALAEKHGLSVIEDNAQAIGSEYLDRRTGYFGHIGCLSFFPSKNLGCYGDGGAVLTNDAELHQRMVEIANHGARKKYRNDRVGLNSRLDAVQAAVLRVKLRHLDAFTKARQTAAATYDRLLEDCPGVVTPHLASGVTHVYHQYTIRLSGAGGSARDRLAAQLSERGIATAVYYPAPIYRFDAYRDGLRNDQGLPHTEQACREVLSLPMHTELTSEQQSRVADSMRELLGGRAHG